MQFHDANLASCYTLRNSGAGIAGPFTGCYDPLMDMTKTRSERRRAALIKLVDSFVPARFETQRELAEALGLSPAHMSQMKSGNRTIGNESADKIEQGLGLPSGALDRGESLLLPSPNSDDAHDRIESNVSPGPDVRGRVPLISWVQAGMWNEAIDIYEPGYAEEWLPILQNGGNHAYALRVDGDSMTAAHGKSYPEGTIIIVNPDQRSPVTGQRIVARLRGSERVTFKQYVEEDGRRWLKPLNPMHPPIHDEFVVLGTVVAKYEID